MCKCSCLCEILVNILFNNFLLEADAPFKLSLKMCKKYVGGGGMLVKMIFLVNFYCLLISGLLLLLVFFFFSSTTKKKSLHGCPCVIFLKYLGRTAPMFYSSICCLFIAEKHNRNLINDWNKIVFVLICRFPKLEWLLRFSLCDWWKLFWFSFKKNKQISLFFIF